MDMKPEFEYTMSGNRYLYRPTKINRTEEEKANAEYRFNELLKRLEAETKK